MNMHKVRQLATLLHTNYSPEVQRYVSSELEGLGLTIAEMYHFLEMKTPFVEVFRDAGEKNTSSAIHSHRFLEIVYCQSSYGAQYLIGSQRYDLQHGDIVIVPPGVSHASLMPGQSIEPYRSIVLWISPVYLSKLQENFPYFQNYVIPGGTVIRTTGTYWEHLDLYFQNIMDEDSLQAAGAKPAMAAYVILLLTQITRALTDTSIPTQALEKEELLDRILAYVESSLPEKLTLEGTADRFWISSTTLSGLFRQKMGISFYQYILQRRVAEAKNLIYDQEPIDKIPGKVGFGDYSAFFRAFKKEVGMSPRQFRKFIGSDPDRKDV